MNNKKVRRLMLELNKIRGGMDMFSMIRLVGYFGLILKAETDRLEGVYDDKYSSAYLALTYGGLVGPDELAAYLESLEAAYHIPIRMVSVEVLSILSDADRQMIFYKCPAFLKQADDAAGVFRIVKRVLKP